MAHLGVNARILNHLPPRSAEQLPSELWGGTGKVTTIENDFKRYVGAQIGIYNLKGTKVGKISHLTNKEYVYVVSRESGAGLFRSLRGLRVHASGITQTAP